MRMNLLHLVWQTPKIENPESELFPDVFAPLGEQLGNPDISLTD
jgi:hypothetical protein